MAQNDHETGAKRDADRAARPTPTSQENQQLRPGAAQEAQAQARSEIHEYLTVSQQRRRLFPRAALVGFLAGVVAVAFRAALEGGDALRTALIAWAHHYPAIGWLVPIGFCMAGAALGLGLVRRYAPEAAGSGIPHLEAVLHRLRELNWRRVLPVKFFGGAAAIGSGLALGREGPTVQIGGACGALVSDLLHVSNRERLVLMAAGAGAGLAAAFNAPLAGVIFVLEEMQKDFRQAVFGAAFIAAAASDIVTRAVSGQFPVFSAPAYAVPALSVLPAFAILGLFAGALGVAYNRSLIWTLDLFARIPGRFAVLGAATVGAAAGIVGWFAPGILGGGHHLAQRFLEGHAVLSAIPILFVIRFVLSMASYGCGAPGGLFAPLLVLGALLGLGYGETLHTFFPQAVPIPAIFAVVGMAAYFTAIVRAPLTGIVLIVEMTGDYAQMLPLLVACFCAYAVAELANELPIYENLLQRDLLRGGPRPTFTEPIVLELEVEPGAPFAGCEIRELGLPPGVVLISLRDGARETVPTPTARLEPHMRVTAVISPNAKRGLEAFREGCEAPE